MKNPNAPYSAAKILHTALAGLTPRQKEVICGRFGLERFSTPLTLAALGTRYGVTRERVRQIENGALIAVREKIAADPGCQDVMGRIAKYLEGSGGVVRRDALLAHVSSFVDGADENLLRLFHQATRNFFEHIEDRDFHPFYFSDKERFRLAASFINQWVGAVRSKKKDVLAGKYHEQLRGHVRQSATSEAHAQNYLAISKKFGKNAYGDHGLTEWPEIAPRTVRDRIYLALQKHGKPLHFRTIADFVNKSELKLRRASAPTVHNELIKDKRFVLVGRGMYGLSEHGFEPGTAREVIQRVLKRQGALKPRDVILAVERERSFKSNTILVNLQNRNYFRRLPDGTYRVREA